MNIHTHTKLENYMCLKKAFTQYHEFHSWDELNLFLAFASDQEMKVKVVSTDSKNNSFIVNYQDKYGDPYIMKCFQMWIEDL